MPTHAGFHLNGRAKKQALLIELEFLTWRMARSWSYSAQLGKEEGLRANGVECLTIPVMRDVPGSSPASWLPYARRLCAGKHFDQVWVELVHSPLDEPCLEWLSTLAPVRIGFLPESLEYTPEEYTLAPNLVGRKSLVERRLKYVTHVLAADEKDAEEINARQLARAMWWPAPVAARFLVKQIPPVLQPYAIFCGALYGERVNWLARPDLKGLLMHLPPPEDATLYPRFFDELNQAADTLLRSGEPVDEQGLATYLDGIRRIRGEIFSWWLKGLQTGCAVVNLPHYVKAYAGRVVEAMAAGRPVISWEIPDRPRNKALFEDGKEILLFSKDDPTQLATHIQRILREPDLGHRIAENALHKLKHFHTIEKRIQQVLTWVETGIEPDYADAEGIEVMAPEVDRYYVDLFVNNPASSTPAPTSDERARWLKISPYLGKIAQAVAGGLEWGLRILDLGCGRGWLTNFASAYGVCEGVDPVAEVVQHAQRMFPHLKFYTGTAQTVLNSPDFKPYDVVVMCEVIEHVPREQQLEFVRDVHRLLKPRGYVILSTPRGEVLDRWKQITQGLQPVEDWLTEAEVRQLFESQGYRCLGRDSIFFDIPSMEHILNPTPADFTSRNLLEVYQIWAFEWGAGPQPATIPAQASSRVLIACTHFWPSVGGLETIAENLGHQLVQRGHQVEVATLAHPGRTSVHYRGMKILSLDPNGVEGKMPLWVVQLRQLVTSGDYDACILMADPLNLVIWSLDNADIPAHTRVLIQPLINRAGYEQWKDNQEFRTRLAAILKNATATIALTRNGTEVTYLREEGIDPVYLPNAVDCLPPPYNFRQTYRIPEDAFMLLHVGNLWEVKNHLGLLQVLHEMPDDWRLVLIGYPGGDAEYVARVQAELLLHPNALYIPGLPPEGVAAAMAAADVVVLASHGEVAPVTILEAMSHGKPWVATPDCGAVHDWAGGLIAPLGDFPAVLTRLWEDHRLRQTLGQAGYQHWQACYSWEVVAAAWDELIKAVGQIGNLSSSFDMPPPVARQMREIKQAVGQIGNLSQDPLVSIIVPTHNRPDQLCQALQSIAAQSLQDFEVIVVNDGGRDVSDVVRYFNQNGGARFHYVCHERTRGAAAARNTGLRDARGKYICFLDDDDVLYPDHLATLVSALEQSDYRVAYTDSYRATQEFKNGEYIPVRWELAMSHDFDRDLFLQDNLTPILNVMVERSCLEAVGGMDEQLEVLEDWELWIRLSRKFDFLHIPKVTAEVRVRPDNSHLGSRRANRFPPCREYIFRKHESHYAELNGRRRAQQQPWHGGGPAQLRVNASPPGTRAQVEPLLNAGSGDLSRLQQLKVALIYDNTIRPDTTGEYCRRALESICRVTHIAPQRLPSLQPQDFDLFLHIDDGLQYVLPPDLRPAAWWVIDTHLQYEWDVQKARQFDAVFAAQRDGAERLNSDGVPAVWLPLAADPAVHRPLPYPEKFDWCFVGHLTEPGNPIGPDRAALIELLKQTFPNYFVGRAFGDEMCRVYAGSRVVFNRSVRDDVNMRVFEALACGRPLLTNALDHNGLDRLLSENIDYVAYRNSDDLLARMEALLSNEDRRRALSRSGRETVLTRHTYAHRMSAVLTWLLQERLVAHSTLISLPQPPLASPPPMPLTTIIILTHNQLDHTRMCLASIEAHTPQPHELIIVDNGSTDGTRDYLRAYAATHDHVRVIANATNRGFAAGNNQALALARGEYVLLLNNDTAVTDGWLERLLAVFARYPQTGIVGPMSNFVAGPQQVPNTTYRSLAEMEDFAAGWAAAHAGQSAPAVRVVGFCLLARRVVIEHIGGLDEQFGSGNFEDDDFCLRAALAGFETRIAQDVFIHHTGNQTFRGANIDYHQSLRRNWEVFKAKWGLPAGLPYEKGYPYPLQPPPGLSLSCPLPDIRTDHQPEVGERWWAEIPNLQCGINSNEGAEALLQQANAAVNRGDLAAASRSLRDCIDRYPAYAEGYVALASVSSAQGDYAQAQDLLLTAIELDPTRPEWFNQLGCAYFATDRSDLAEQAFRQALDLDPEGAESLLNLAELYRGAGRYAEAATLLKRALEHHRDHPDVLMAFGNFCLEVDEPEAAQMAFRRVHLTPVDQQHA